MHSERMQIAINLNKILTGSAPDVQLEPEDIVFVPDNKAKRALSRAADAAVTLVTGIAIWRIGGIN